jgi:hypothetical protein
MPRHESVTDEYVAELRAGLLVRADRVKAAPDWSETQRLLVTYTDPSIVAQGRVDQGWTREEIAQELAVRITAARLTGTTKVIGDEKRDEMS